MFFGATEEPPVISADGNHFAFQSCEPWLRDDQAPICDIYIMGSVYGPFVNASTTADGQLSDDTSEDPVLSADGRFLVFRTRSTTLLPIGTPPGQLVIRDRDLDGNGVFDEPGPDKVRIEVVSLSDGAATRRQHQRQRRGQRRRAVHCVPIAGQQPGLRRHEQRLGRVPPRSRRRRSDPPHQRRMGWAAGDADGRFTRHLDGRERRRDRLRDRRHVSGESPDAPHSRHERRARHRGVRTVEQHAPADQHRRRAW